MKRLIIVSVITLLLVGVVLLGAVAKHGTNGQTNVAWSVDGCWIKLEVHKDVNLGKITAPDQVLENTTGNDVSLRTNCAKGYILNVKAVEASTPKDFTGNILDDFAWKVVKATGNVKEYQADYTGFPNFGVEMKVGASDKPGRAEFQMGYKYTSDDEDVPGDYSVTLEYTATSQ